MIPYLIALGANLPSSIGPPRYTILCAVEDLVSTVGGSVRWGGLYQSTAVPVSDQPDFVNTVVELWCDRSPDQLLALLLEIEQKYGRQRRDRWSARTLDMDILAQDDKILPGEQSWRMIAEHEDPAAMTAELMIPHPRLHKREFVLRPLCDVRPDGVHPVLGFKAQTLLDRLQPVRDERIWKLGDDFS